MSIAGEKADHDRFRDICARERISPADKVNEWIKEYNKVHGDGNPQYSLDQWHTQPDFKAVPALLSEKQKWFQHFDHAEFEDLDEIERQADFLRKAAKSAKENKLMEAARSLRKNRSTLQVRSMKALPENSDPGIMRKAELRRLFKDILTNSLYDRKGGTACRARRNQVITHILTLQELLPEYGRCQEYDEWMEAQKYV